MPIKNKLIAVSSLSPVISAGMMAVLRAQLSGTGTGVIEVAPENLLKAVALRKADIVVADQWVLDRETVSELRSGGHGNVRIVAIAVSNLPEKISSLADGVVSVTDSPEKIAEALVKCMPKQQEEERKELSPREKDVIIGVVKGLSNKEIADHLNVSTHTVMTHRRNIASKLQIHSPAGLTIYALVSHLVSLDEVRDTI